jgi:hypothetical protein
VNHDRIVARFGQSRRDMPSQPDFIVYHENAHDIIAKAKSELRLRRQIVFDRERAKVTGLLP